MARFTTHVVVGAAVSGIVASGFLFSGIATPRQFAWYFVAGFTGSLVPDIDYKDSFFLRTIFAFLGVALATWVVFFLFIYIWSLFEIFIIWLLIFLVVYYGFYGLFISLTLHRGLFHSVAAAFFAWALTTFVAFWVFYFPPFYCWALGFMVWVGYITHLILDEIFHVDLEGVVVKDYRYFTVFKFYSPNTSIFLNIFLWFATFALFWWCPTHSTFFSYLFGPNYYSSYYARGYPRGGWFVYRPGTNVYVAPGAEQGPLRDPYQPGRYRDDRWGDGRY